MNPWHAIALGFGTWLADAAAHAHSALGVIVPAVLAVAALWQCWETRARNRNDREKLDFEKSKVKP